MVAGHATAPKMAPMPAVMPSATAPQKTTRTTGFSMAAPPVRALTAPKAPKKNSDAAETIGMRALGGARNTINKGRKAPTENVVAEVNAAWMGRAVVVSEMPK